MPSPDIEQLELAYGQVRLLLQSLLTAKEHPTPFANTLMFARAQALRYLQTHCSDCGRELEGSHFPLMPPDNVNVSPYCDHCNEQLQRRIQHAREHGTVAQPRLQAEVELCQRVFGLQHNTYLDSHLLGTGLYGVVCSSTIPGQWIMILLEHPNNAVVYATLDAAHQLGFTAFGFRDVDQQGWGNAIYLLFDQPANPAGLRAVGVAIASRAAVVAEVYPSGSVLAENIPLPLGVNSRSNRRGILVFQDGREINLDQGGQDTIQLALHALSDLPRNQRHQVPFESMQKPIDVQAATGAGPLLRQPHQRQSRTKK